MKERTIEERVDNIVTMLESSTTFTASYLDKLDIAIPQKAKKAIIDIMQSDEIKGIVEDVKTRRPPRIVMMGRSGVGKSSLINAMFDTYLAKTSDIDVGTVEHEFFQYEKNGKVIFEIIDTRGIKENIKEGAHSAEDELLSVITDFKPDAFLFVTNGADRSALNEDTAELNYIFNQMSIQPPLITVITRVDELHPSREKDPLHYPDGKVENIGQKVRQVKDVLRHAGLAQSFIVPVSAYVEWSHEDPESLPVDQRELLTIEFDGRYNLDELFDVLEDNIDFNAAIDLMFNHKVDKAIEKIAMIFVKRFSQASAAVGATPIPGADILILLPIQIVEVTLVAYVSGKEIDATSAREFILSLGAVFLFGFGLRFVAQQSTKLLNVVPGAGSAISATVAYSGTYSIGKAAIAYYINGKSMREAKREAEIAKNELEIVEAPSKKAPKPKQEPPKQKRKLGKTKDKAKQNWTKVRTKIPWKRK